MKTFKVIILLLLSSLVLQSSWAQGKTSTSLHNGKKLIWNAKAIQVETKDAKGGQKSTREILERGTLKSYDGEDVAYKISKSVVKNIKKEAQKAIKSVDVPKFHDRNLTVHLTNFVVDKEGKLAYYEVLLFPYKQSMQLYPNEYTEEIKSYLKKIDAKLSQLNGLGTQKQAAFSQEIIVL